MGVNVKIGSTVSKFNALHTNHSNKRNNKPNFEDRFAHPALGRSLTHTSVSFSSEKWWFLDRSRRSKERKIFSLLTDHRGVRIIHNYLRQRTEIFCKHYN